MGRHVRRSRAVLCPHQQMTYVEMTALSSLVRPMLARAARLNLLAKQMIETGHIKPPGLFQICLGANRLPLRR
jgi:hypothetical protein